MLVEFDEFKLVDRIRHVHLAEHAASRAHVFDHEKAQRPHYFECSRRNDLFRRGGTKQRRKEIQFPKLLIHNDL